MLSADQIVFVPGQVDCSDGHWSEKCGWGNRDVIERGGSSNISVPKGGGGRSPAAENQSLAIADNNSKTCPASGNPVILTTGEKFKEEADFASFGVYGLNLQRTYRSMQAAGKMFGPYWLSNLDGPSLRATGTCTTITEEGVCVREVATITEANGVKYSYQNLNKYEPGPDGSYGYSSRNSAAAGDLKYIPGEGWTLSKGEVIYTFAENGKIQSIGDLNGVGISFIYAPDGRLNKVYNAVGQFVEVVWGGNNRVSKVFDPARNEWKYEYNPAGMLTKVTSRERRQTFGNTITKTPTTRC